MGFEPVFYLWVVIMDVVKLVDLLPPDNAELQVIRNGIGQAREFLAKQPGGKEKLAQFPAGNAPQEAAADSAGAVGGENPTKP